MGETLYVLYLHHIHTLKKIKLFNLLYENQILRDNSNNIIPSPVNMSYQFY